jgi:hypothetical protein
MSSNNGIIVVGATRSLASGCSAALQLACWEHCLSLPRYALIADGEQIHSAMHPACRPPGWRFSARCCRRGGGVIDVLRAAPPPSNSDPV